MKKFSPAVLATAIAAAFNVSASENTTFAIEEIVVTAQKRAQSVADIGVTVTAFGGEDIKDLRFDSPKDIASHTPGLSSANATSGGNPIFAIRGIGLDDFNSNNTSGVGVYVDEVLAAYPVFLNGQLFDVERVEVLKGPQGTLYGKNTTGGAINYVSVKPDESFSGYLTAGLSRWNTYKVEGAVGGSVMDGVNSRLAFFTSDGDGWQKDVDTGREFGNTDRLALRSLTEFALGDNADLMLGLRYSKDKSTPSISQNRTIDSIFFLPANTLGVVSNNAKDVRVGSLDVARDEKGYGATANLSIDFSDFSFVSITSADFYERDVQDNLDGASVNTNDFSFEDEFDVYSQEFRLTSNAISGFSWVAGLSFSKDKVSAKTTIDTGFLTDALLGPGVVNQHRTQSDYTQNSTSLGAFVHTETDLTDEMTLTVGARYSEDTREFDGTSIDLDGYIPLFAGGPQIPGFVTAALDDEQTERNLSGKIGLDYALSEDWLLYGSVSTSYKAGVFYASPVGAAEALSYVDPEEVMAYEVGFKGALLDNSMQITGAAYVYNYDDRQSLVTALHPTIPGLAFATLGNIEESEISGGELEFRWLPMQGLDVRAGVSYIDSEVSKAPVNVRGFALAAPIAEGESLAQSPEWSYSTVVRYEWNLVDSMIASVQAQYSWADEQVSALGDPNASYGEVDNLGARLSLESIDSSWELSAWIDNLENKNASTYAFSSAEGGRVTTRQLPRNYGVEFTLYF